MMKKRVRHTPEQIVRKLALADKLLAEGKETADVARELGVAETTYFRWRNQYGGLKARMPSASRSWRSRTRH
jgi:transposase-like protein